MKRICAWCDKGLPDVEPLNDQRTTHSICEECAEGLKEETFELMDCSDILYPEAGED